MIDQTRLPFFFEIRSLRSVDDVYEAIDKMVVRGAPLIGASAAFGIYLAALEITHQTNIRDHLANAARYLVSCRPTAVNLSWAVKRMMQVASSLPDTLSQKDQVDRLETEALAISAEDRSANGLMAAYGATLFTKPVCVLTHCNAGALATVAVGTALGVITRAWQAGNITGVYADETRPLLQGSRLTAFELSRSGIPVTLITDNMAAWVMKTGRVQAVIVGADRVAANGDVANKIGTYGLAVLAKVHNIPFYVAAPLSTFDFSLSDGSMIPIEERHADEVFHFAGVRTAPHGISAFNPAFDVTPAGYVSAIITEAGIATAPYEASINKLSKRKDEIK